MEQLLIAALGAAFLVTALDYLVYLGAYRAGVALIASVGLLQALGVTPILTLVATSFGAAFAAMALLRALERMDRVTTTVRGPR
jgi:pimeloyl-ACP methyl ester carboxylesterase